MNSAPHTTSSIQVHPVSLSPKDVHRFLMFAYTVYGDDPNWVAPLLMDVKKVFTQANPLFEHAEMQLWIATRDGKDVGRIAGVLDRTYNSIQKDNAIFFGFYECIDDAEVSRQLFAAVYAWGKTKGARRVLGPMNPTTNDECGLLIKGYDSPPVLMMTYNPPYYEKLIEAEGLVKAKDLLAYYLAIATSPVERLGRIAAKVRARNPELTFRCVRRKTLEADLGKVKLVYNSAWEANWGFVPMTDAEIDFMAERLKPLLCEGLIWLAETPQEPVGFLLAIPDYNEAFKPLKGRVLTPKILGFLPYLLGWKNPKMCRDLTLGVVAKYRNRGLESVMLYEGYCTAQRLNMVAAEGSWILEDNTMMCRMMEHFGGVPYKTYRLYDKPI